MTLDANEEYIEFINTMNDGLSKATVLFYETIRDDKADAIGTGFILQSKNNFTFIVTAKHVIENTKQEKLYAKLSTEIIEVDLKYFVKSWTNDIALILINDLLNIPAYTIQSSQINQMETLDFFALMIGFPHTKNNFEPKYDKTTSNFSSIYLYKMIKDYRSETEIENPIVCELDDNKVIGNDGLKVNMHKLNGMSGSPFFNISKKSSGIDINLVGIFVEWHKNTKEAIFVRASEILELIENSETFPCGCCGNMLDINPHN